MLKNIMRDFIPKVPYSTLLDSYVLASYVFVAVVTFESTTLPIVVQKLLGSDDKFSSYNISAENLDELVSRFFFI